MMEIVRKVRVFDFSIVAKGGIIGIFMIEFLIGLLIVQGNSAVVSIVITVPRIIGSFLTMIFMLLIMRRQRCINDWKKAVKVIGALCVVLRIVSMIGLKYV